MQYFQVPQWFCLKSIKGSKLTFWTNCAFPLIFFKTVQKASRIKRYHRKFERKSLTVYYEKNYPFDLQWIQADRLRIQTSSFVALDPKYLFSEAASRDFKISEYLTMKRSSRRRCSVRKDVLRNFMKFTGKHLC